MSGLSPGSMSGVRSSFPGGRSLRGQGLARRHRLIGRGRTEELEGATKSILKAQPLSMLCLAFRIVVVVGVCDGFSVPHLRMVWVLVAPCPSRAAAPGVINKNVDTELRTGPRSACALVRRACSRSAVVAPSLRRIASQRFCRPPSGKVVGGRSPPAAQRTCAAPLA